MLTLSAAFAPPTYAALPGQTPGVCKGSMCFINQAAENAYQTANNCRFPTPAPKCTPATSAYWSTMSVSSAGVSFTKSWEKFRPFPYNDSAGNATIGYGHLLHKHPVNADDLALYPKGISEAAATTLFAADMASKSVKYIEADVTVQLTQCQLDALADFTFNVGVGNLEISQVLKDINGCNLTAVAGDFLHFVKGGAGLVIRRNAEGAIWTGCNYQNHN
jgi:GH24 family phage-related lysozyme (muramidase)